MNENRNGAVSEVGEQPVKAIEAAFDVICPGASANAGGSNGSGGKDEVLGILVERFNLDPLPTTDLSEADDPSESRLSRGSLGRGAKADNLLSQIGRSCG